MTHHQEIFPVLDLTLPRDYQDRHKTSEDGETYLFDERCPKCAHDKGFSDGAKTFQEQAAMECSFLHAVHPVGSGRTPDCARLIRNLELVGSAWRTEQ